MQMKKALIVLLALVLLLVGFFFWRGGHHAIYLAEVLEEWFDADDADQSLTIRIQIPGSELRQISLTADTFWTEYADRHLFGVSSRGVTAWTDGKNLYMDTGKAYALPNQSGLNTTVRRLAMGMLLYGRITKNADTYSICMESEELELDVDLTADRTVRAVNFRAVLKDGTEIAGSLIPKTAVPHPIPREISDAIVQTRMEPPIPLTEPLEILLPALEHLLPLEGDLTLGVASGILDIHETVGFSMDTQTAELERKGVAFSIDLPDAYSAGDPALLGLLLLRNGDFTRHGNGAQFEITLPPDATAQLCAALVPQAAELSIDYSESRAVLTIEDGNLSSASLTAEGEVPFLITTIPVEFRAELMVR